LGAHSVPPRVMKNHAFFGFEKQK